MDFSTENDTLSRISKALYGDALTLAVMDPKDISLLKKNARILKKDVFQQLTAENIHVECCMYRLATERFSDVMWAMQQLLFTSFDKRLAQYLWDESDHARAPVRATHEQIARDTGAVRETVTRMLRHFADDGIVSLGRGTVTVADAEKLRRLAGM